MVQARGSAPVAMEMHRMLHPVIKGLELIFAFDHLAATIHTAFQVDMVWAVVIAGIGIFHIGG